MFSKYLNPELDSTIRHLFTNQSQAIGRLNDEYHELKIRQESIKKYLLFNEILNEKTEEQIQTMMISMDHFICKLKKSRRSFNDDYKLNMEFHLLCIKAEILYMSCYHDGYEYLILQDDEARDMLISCVKHAVKALNYLGALPQDKLKNKVDISFLKEIHYSHNVLRSYIVYVENENILAAIKPYEKLLYDTSLKCREIQPVSLYLMYPHMMELYNQGDKSHLHLTQDFLKKSSQLLFKMKNIYLKESPKNYEIRDLLNLNNCNLILNSMTRPVSLLYQETSPILLIGGAPKNSEVYSICEKIIMKCTAPEFERYLEFTHKEINEKITKNIEMLLKIIDTNIFINIHLDDFIQSITIIYNYLFIYFSILKVWIEKHDYFNARQISTLRKEVEFTWNLIETLEVLMSDYMDLSPLVEKWISSQAYYSIPDRDFSSVINRLKKMKQLNQRKEDANDQAVARLIKELKEEKEYAKVLKTERQEKRGKNTMPDLLNEHDWKNESESEEELLIAASNHQNAYSLEEKQLLDIENDVNAIIYSLQPSLKDIRSLLKHRLQRDEAFSQKERNKIIGLGQTVTINALALHGLFKRYQTASINMDSCLQESIDMTRETIRKKISDSHIYMEKILPCYQKIQDQAELHFQNRCFEEGTMYLTSHPELAANLVKISRDEICNLGRKQIHAKARNNRQQLHKKPTNFSQENHLINEQKLEIHKLSKLLSQDINYNFCKK